MLLPKIQPPVVQCEYICFAAINAFAAGAHAGDENAISRLEHRDGRPDLVDDADALMAENAAGLASRDVTLEDVQVGPANRRL